MPGITSFEDGNSLLSGLPAAEWDWLQPRLQSVALEAKTVLHDADRVPDYLHFVQSGYVSLMIGFSDGFQAEVGAVGREGMIGLASALGRGADAAAAVVQVPASAFRLPADTMPSCLDRLPTLRRRLHRYAEHSRAQAMQLGACNARHSLKARLARCLLGIQDRTLSAVVPLTHEALALLLCAHRPSVSLAIKQLEHSGTIHCTTGSLLLTDRAGLENTACGCYRTFHHSLQQHAAEARPVDDLRLLRIGA